jgi:hypothetical protein
MAMRRGRKIAKVAMARKLAVQLCWMCGEDRVTNKCKRSVRMRESPEIAMMCSNAPTQ